MSKSNTPRPLKGSVHSIGPEKKSSVIFHSIGPEKLSYVEGELTRNELQKNGKSRQSIFSGMTVDAIASFVDKTIDEAQALRSEIRQHQVVVAERRCMMHKEVEDEVNVVNKALEAKMNDHQLKVVEYGSQITELELSKMDIDSALRERQKSARQNHQQLDWLVHEKQKAKEISSQSKVDEIEAAIGQLMAEQRAWQGLNKELSESSRNTEVVVADLQRTHEQANVNHQVLKQQLLLNLELLREKPHAPRQEVSVAWE